MSFRVSFCSCVFQSLSIVITSLGEERANLSAFCMFVRFVLVWICWFPLPLGVWEGLRFVIVALTFFFLFVAVAAILFNGAEPLRPSWIFDPHKFSLFRSRSHPVAKEQVLAQSDLRFEKRCRKLIFKMVAVVAILDFLSAHLANFHLISALMLIKFRFNWIIEEMSKI